MLPTRATVYWADAHITTDDVTTATRGDVMQETTGWLWRITSGKVAVVQNRCADPDYQSDGVQTVPLSLVKRIELLAPTGDDIAFSVKVSERKPRGKAKA